MKKISSLHVIIFLFYFILFFINPSNKLAIIFFFLLYLLFFIILKDTKISLLTLYFTSSLIPMGKTYIYKLLDLSFLFPRFPHLHKEYPLGLVRVIQISLNDIIFIFIILYFLFLIRENYKQFIKLIKLDLIDIILFCFLGWNFISNFIVAKNLSLSFYFQKEFFKNIFIYFFIKILISLNKNYYQLIFLLLIKFFIAAVAFESLLSLYQFFNQSPLGKNIEATHSIEVFGKAADEISFYFRPVGTFTHANFLAMWLSNLVFFLIYLFRLKKFKNFSLLILIFLSLMNIGLSLSRGAWFSLFICFLFLSFYFEYLRKEVFIPIKYLIYSLITFTPFFSIVSTRFLKTLFIFNEGGLILRLKQAEEIFNLIKISPFFGWGTGQTIVSAIKINPYGIFASQPFEIHNVYLLITAENGIISLALFFIFLFLVFKKTISLKDNFSIFFLSMMTNLLIIGLFQPYIFMDLILYFISFLNFNLSKNEEIKKYI